MNIPLNIQVKGNPKYSQNNGIEAMVLSRLSNILIINSIVLVVKAKSIEEVREQVIGTFNVLYGK